MRLGEGHSRKRQQHERNREDSSYLNRNRSRSDKEREKEREAMDINGHVDILILRFWGTAQWSYPSGSWKCQAGTGGRSRK